MPGCHTIPGIPNAVGLVGPNLSKIGSEAASRKPGMSAEDYIRESILDPAGFAAPQCPNGPCPAGVMPPNFGERLGQSDIDLIVAYLITLTGEAEVAPVPTYILTPIAIARPKPRSSPLLNRPSSSRTTPKSCWASTSSSTRASRRTAR